LRSRSPDARPILKTHTPPLCAARPSRLEFLCGHRHIVRSRFTARERIVQARRTKKKGKATMTTLTFSGSPRAAAPKSELGAAHLAMLKRFCKGVLAVALFALIVTAIAWIRVAHYMPALWH
jgi:hypothetical protein